MLRVEVYLDEWGRGAADNSQLYNRSTNKKCCLGFAYLAKGVPLENLGGCGSPLTLQALTGEGIEIPKLLNEQGNNSEVCLSLMDTNDVYAMKDELRIAKIIEKGKQADLDFVFLPTRPAPST